MEQKKILEFDEFLQIIEDKYFLPEFFSRSEKIDTDNIKSTADPKELWVWCLESDSEFISPLFNIPFIRSQFRPFKDKPVIQILFEYFNDPGIHNSVRPNHLFDPKYYRDNYYRHENVPPLIEYLDRETQDIVKPYILFDPDYYYKAHGHILDRSVSALLHFLSKGHLISCNPNPLFSIKFIKKRYLNLPVRQNPLISYLRDNMYNINKTSEYFDGEYLFRKNQIEEINCTPLEYFFMHSSDHSLVTSSHFDPVEYIANSGITKEHPVLDYLTAENKAPPPIHIDPVIKDQIYALAKTDDTVLNNGKIDLNQFQFSQPFISPALRLINKIIPKLSSEYHFILILNQLDSGIVNLLDNLLNSTEYRGPNILIIMPDEDVELRSFDRELNKYIEYIIFNQYFERSNLTNRLKVLTHLMANIKTSRVIVSDSLCGREMLIKYLKPLSSLVPISYYIGSDLDFENKTQDTLNFVNRNSKYFKSLIFENEDIMFRTENFSANAKNHGLEKEFLRFLIPNLRSF